MLQYGHAGRSATARGRGSVLDRAGLVERGHLLLGSPKNGEAREAELWPLLADELEELYQAQGAPPLDALVFPNRHGGLSDWGNWRTNRWYPALHRAGLSDEPRPEVEGAFDPYSMRHTCATLLFYVRPPDGGERYAETDIAAHLGHTIGTLLAHYAAVRREMRPYAGMTMNDVIASARQEVWGPQPGDPGFVERWLTVREASELSGLSVKALHARIARGTLAASRESGQWRARERELRACLS